MCIPNMLYSTCSPILKGGLPDSLSEEFDPPGRLGPGGDFDRLFVVGGHRVALVAVQGDVDDPEVDLRFDPSGAGSNTVTLGEP
jgi:hypothetical protein